MKLSNGINAQIEPHKKSDQIVVGCPLGEVPPGKYRQELFRTALICNGQPPPSVGTCAFSRSQGICCIHYAPDKEPHRRQDRRSADPLSEKALLCAKLSCAVRFPALFLSRGGASFGGLFGLPH